MKNIRMIALLFFCSFRVIANAQEINATAAAALKTDDTAKLATVINKENLNNCYQENERGYSLLSQTVRANAKNCFNWLIAKGADVNKSCNGYVPPLMHAAKYGRLDMVKILVAKGADINYTYYGDYKTAEGETPITYAEKYGHYDIADYLKAVKKQ